MYNYTSPDTTMKTGGLVAAGASTMLNRTNTLVNYGFGEVGEASGERFGIPLTESVHQWSKTHNAIVYNNGYVYDNGYNNGCDQSYGSSYSNGYEKDLTMFMLIGLHPHFNKKTKTKR